MATKKTTKKVRKAKKRMNRTARIFWVALIVFLAPFIVLGWILVSAMFDTGKPILGNRYENDLNPAITNDQMNSIESQTKSLGGVEKTDIQLATGTLRVYADINDSADVTTAESVSSQIYDIVTSVLDPNVYFSQYDGKKMYDLEVHVYNLDKNRDSDSFVYVIETKTSSMDYPLTQVMSEPVDAELAEQLRQAVEARKNPTPEPTEDTSGELQLGSEDTEEVPQENQESQEG